MHNLINAIPLYNFIKYCNASRLEKIVLDCGAGGANPPLSLFDEFNYKIYGIELCDEQIERAKVFCENHNVNLNIIKGDMIEIPFENKSFNFLYSYNTSVHIRKKDFESALKEFYRVLNIEGLCYVNFLSEECDSFGQGLIIGDGEFLNNDDGEEVFYVHYKEVEAEEILKNSGFKIIYKEKRIISRINNGVEQKTAHIDFILQK